MAVSVEIVSTEPYAGQKPGTSGLRKKVTVFKEKNYLGNFVQAIFDALPEAEYKGRTLLCSGDGRYFNKEAIQIVAEIAAANGVDRLWVGEHGWFSTPAASATIREREGGICAGGILLTASHNPGGETEDFGIKFNCANGGPAPENITNAIFQKTQVIKEIKRATLPLISTSKLGKETHELENGQKFTVEIINPYEDWVKLIKSVFDMESIKALIANPEFSFVYDALNGIAGPYAKELFLKELGASEKSLLQCESKEDFGGCHPDPNLTYAKALVETMKVFHPESADETTPLFGAAGDGDNDRNMILGRGWFVTPSDSVAIIAAYAPKCIPYFKDGLKGVSRSMPTSLALKKVADKLGYKHYEVPTGWKFFGNLMDAGLCSICGEESFGTGSDHVREKDGLWAVLCWLSILAYEAKQQGRIVTVKEVNEKFWQTYGRNYYSRYDYEGVTTEAGDEVMARMSKCKADSYGEVSAQTAKYLETNPVVDINIFKYEDVVDKSISDNQGVRVFFKDDSRFVIRLSGTGSSGATIRVFFER